MAQEQKYCVSDTGRQILQVKSTSTSKTKPNKPYGIIWAQNVHFVTTSSFNGNGSLVSSRARFLKFCFTILLVKLISQSGHTQSKEAFNQ